jgi:ubiquinone/menaquinone biosynthesis C-methylase UbiE
MTIIDKSHVLERMNYMPEVVLELGCGNRKRLNNSIGVDLLDYDSVDIVGDVFAVLARIPDTVVDAVHSHHFFEHVSPLDTLMNELARVIKPGGRLEVVVPHFSNPYFYSDYTHKIFFGLYSFSYFTQDNFLKRKTPHYNRTLAFELQEVHLRFRSARPFYIRYGIKVVLEKIFNYNTFMKEFYEENLCWIFPCYEIKFTIIKI